MWKDILIDNMLFVGDGGYHIHKANMQMFGLMFWGLKLIASLLLLLAMLVGWSIQRGLLTRLFKSDSTFAEFMTTSKISRLAIGAPVLYGIQQLGLWLETFGSSAAV